MNMMFCFELIYQTVHTSAPKSTRYLINKLYSTATFHGFSFTHCVCNIFDNSDLFVITLNIER